ncbi:acyltransferase family protein [Lichenicoccus sp.]|uniref:acyltransferase family protein n=1 Tax=Lichenicoccus sp. TaxID=2781899 RepID=UPI003D0A49FD
MQISRAEILPARNRYELLDGLRGIAALAVMFYHLNRRAGAPSLMPHGWLAVDFFFMLSGFVLAHSYSERLRGMTLGAFFGLRARRLLPLSMLGVMLGLAYFLLRWKTQAPAADDVSHVMLATGLNLLLIPNLHPGGVTGDWLFPGNNVLWSLALEFLVNLVWAVIVIRAGKVVLCALSLAAALLLVLLAHQQASVNLGFTWDTLPGGAARTMFGFFLGVLVWHLRPQPVHSRTVPWVAACGLLAIFCLPDTHWQVDLLMVLFGLPAILWLSIGVDYRPERPGMRLLGEISYPLYVIHMPILMLLAGWLKHRRPDLHGSAWIDAAALPIMLLAWLAGRYYDEPVRRLLQRARGPRAAMARVSGAR